MHKLQVFTERDLRNIQQSQSKEYLPLIPRSRLILILNTRVIFRVRESPKEKIRAICLCTVIGSLGIYIWISSYSSNMFYQIGSDTFRYIDLNIQDSLFLLDANSIGAYLNFRSQP